MVCATILAAAVSASAKEGEKRTCETKLGGQVVCGDYVVGITLEQYEAGLKKRAEEIRGEETEKRVQLQKLMELTERATSAEKEKLQSQIAAVEADKRALEAESKGVADRLTNLQASYDEVAQKLAQVQVSYDETAQKLAQAKKLAEATAMLVEIAPLISNVVFRETVGMLSRGDVLGAERNFGQIRATLDKIREQAEVVEARVFFERGKIAEVRCRYDEAEPLYRRAIEIFQNNLGSDDPNTRAARESYDRLQELKQQCDNPAR
jgi:tetratricopeptide (TPR) repeat protein